jgi:glutamine synthetase
MSSLVPPTLADDLRAWGVRDVECVFPDVTGHPRGKLMPVAAFAAGAELRMAEAVTTQCVTGEYPEHELFPDQDPDIRMVPDYATLRRVPWTAKPRAMAIHDCVGLDGSACDFAPRTVLRRVLERYTARGWTPVVAPEIEFYLVAPNTDPSQPLVPPPARGGRVERGQSAFSMHMLAEQEAFWDEFREALDVLGVRADTWIHEAGLSQFEINLVHGNALDVCDQAFLFKLAAREVAMKHDMQAVFMAKPIQGEAGSSMHVHQSIVDAQGRNVFSEADGSESAAFLQFIAGLQANLPDLMLVFAPFINSFRRFVKGSQAPVNFDWGHDNRTAGLRIPRSGPVARRVENRVAGADANPYLVVAATLAAGLDGVERGLVPDAPLEGSAYAKAHGLPRTFLGAYEAFVNGESPRRLLGDRFVEGYAAVKETEHEHWLAEIGTWERRYLVPQA